MQDLTLQRNLTLVDFYCVDPCMHGPLTIPWLSNYEINAVDSLLEILKEANAIAF